MPSLSTPKITLQLPNKRLLIFAASVLIGGVVLWWLLLTIAYSEESVRAQTMRALEMHFGRKVTAAEVGYYSTLPVPRLVLENLNVANDPRSRETVMLRVPQVTVTVNPLAMFSNHLVVSLRLEAPKLELEHFSDGSASWSAKKTPKSKTAAALISGVNMVSGQVRYQYPSSQREVIISGIEADVHFPSAEEIQASGVMQWGKAHYEFGLGLSAEGDDALALKTFLFDGVTRLSAEGIWQPNTKSFRGKQQFESDDVGALLENFLPQTENIGASAKNPAQQTEEEANALAEAAKKLHYPLKWSSDLRYEADALALEDIKIEGKYLEGEGAINIVLSAIPDIDANLQMDRVSFEPLVERGVIRTLLTQNEKTEIREGFSVSLDENKRGASLPQGIKLHLRATSKEAVIAGVPTTETQSDVLLQNGKAVISQLSGKLSGKGQFLFKGESNGTFDGIVLKGQLDLAGEEFGRFVASVFGDELQAPQYLKQFRARTNLYLAPDLARFSETIVRVEDFQALGTVLRQYTPPKPSLQPVKDGEAPPPKPLGLVSYEGALRLDNLNLDEWQKAQKEPTKGTLEGYPRLLRMLQGWQRKMQQYNQKLSLKINLNNLVFLNQPNPGASLDLAMEAGGIALNHLQCSYKDTFVSGNIGLAFPPQSLPHLVVDLKADMLDSAVFFDHDFSKDEKWWQQDSGWSRKEFDLNWIKQYTGHLSLEIAQLKHSAYEFTNLILDAEVKDSALQLNSVAAQIWGGEMAARGRLVASRLPTFNLGISSKGLVIEKLRSATDIVGNLRGRLSASGEFTTTGINAQSAMKNAQGTVSLAGRGLTITGFNLANMVRAANEVRTVSDIQKLVEYANQGGVTTIDYVQGNANLMGGFLRTPGMSLGTREGSGAINGQLNVMDWDINTAITIYLTSLQRESPPSIRLIFAGPLDKAARTLDTQSLETFIAKKAANRVLDTQ